MSSIQSSFYHPITPLQAVAAGVISFGAVGTLSLLSFSSTSVIGTALTIATLAAGIFLYARYNETRLKKRNEHTNAHNLSREHPFDQSVLCRAMGESYPDLQRVVQIYGGLCSPICFFVLENDLLDQNAPEAHLQNTITLDALSAPNAQVVHLLEIYHPRDQKRAIEHGVYPHNVFSTKEQKRLVIEDPSSKERALNHALLQKALLRRLDIGKTWFVASFGIENKRFDGHSLLIKKISETHCIYFDPNFGDETLSFNQIEEKLESHLSLTARPHLLFIPGEEVLKQKSEAKEWYREYA